MTTYEALITNMYACLLDYIYNGFFLKLKYSHYCKYN